MADIYVKSNWIYSSVGICSGAEMLQVVLMWLLNDVTVSSVSCIFHRWSFSGICWFWKLVFHFKRSFTLQQLSCCYYSLWHEIDYKKTRLTRDTSPTPCCETTLTHPFLSTYPVLAGSYPSCPRSRGGGGYTLEMCLTQCWSYVYF